MNRPEVETCGFSQGNAKEELQRHREAVDAVKVPDTGISFFSCFLMLVIVMPLLLLLLMKDDE